MRRPFALVSTVLLSLMSINACTSHSQNTACASTDLECFLVSLTVQSSGSTLALQTIATSRLSPSGASGIQPSLWAVGTTIAGWNGTSWSAYTNPAPGTALNAVWTFASDDAWAAGGDDTLLHWNGSTWSTVTLPGNNGSGSTGADTIVGLWGDSPDDLWAISSTGSATHFTGPSLTNWSSPITITTSGTLSAIWGFSANDIWAVGATNGGGGAAFHYDGSSWTSTNIAATAGLSAIWGDASSDVWAVTGQGNGDSTMFRWNGSSWSEDVAASQVVANISAPVYLTGTSPTDVWESGYNISGNIVAHDDGSRWTLQPSFGSLLQGGSLWAAATNDLWMVGTDFQHWNGSSWTAASGPAGTYTSVRGVVPNNATNSAAPPSITNTPAAMTLTGGSTAVSETFDWSDPSGCQPAFCFSLCSSAISSSATNSSTTVQCTTQARCTSSVHDGLLTGATILTLGYTAAPSNGAAELTLEVVPVSSANCQNDPIAELTAGATGPSGATSELIGATVTIAQTVTAATPVSTGSSIVGTWKATSTSTSGADTSSDTFIYTFNSDGSEAYSSMTNDTYTDGTPSASSSCATSGTYTTSGNSITITTPTYPAECGFIVSPYTTTFAISGTTLTFAGDSSTYIKQ